jgi:DNA-binding MarR family transcriptional regulator
METQLDKRFGFLVSDVGRLSGKRFDDLAKSSLALTRAQCRALAYLSHHGEVNQARLADLLEVAPISAGRLLDRMEEGGWIERLSNPQDRRQRQIRMTAKAQKALDSARRVGDVVAAEALRGFTQREHEQLIDLLQRVRANLSRIVDSEPATAESRSETKGVLRKRG